MIGRRIRPAVVAGATIVAIATGTTTAPSADARSAFDHRADGAAEPHPTRPGRLRSFIARADSTPGASRGQTPPPHRSIADSLLALMTLDEKIGQLTQSPANWGQTGPAAAAGDEAEVRAGHVGSFLSFWGAARTLHMQHVAVEQSRLHIPLLFAQDVIHGWRTVFPVPLASAGTFDSARVAGAARIAATEATAQGIHWTFAPMVDIARDPRWGRIVEGAGEDPHLGAVMAAAQVRGFQGDDLAAPTTFLATAKHFAVYGAAEGGRDYNVADVGERTIWEIYFPPFEAAVRTGVATVMPSFNEIGGTPAHANHWLLTDVLRRHWGFNGVTVSDWAGIEELITHGLGDSATVAARAMNAGVDVEMASTLYRRTLAEDVRSGRVPMAAVDSAVLRVLRAKEALGLFRDPYRYSDTTREKTAELTPEHRSFARALAREAIVLLTNGTGALPLPRTVQSLAVIGPLADDPSQPLGSWSGAGKPADVITPLAGLREALPHARITFERGVPIDTVRTDGIAAAVRAAQGADAVILVLGEDREMSGEASSRSSIELPGAQLQLAQAVIRTAHGTSPRKPVIAVLMNGRPLAVPYLADSADALVESWYLGVEHGHALADVLTGVYNPSGRLPVTFPRATGQVPIYYNHKNTGRPASATDKYTSKYLDVPWTPLFPFGHGLSYTTFAYGPVQLAAPSVRNGEAVGVTVTVRNSGARAGDEVVQLYVHDDAASVTRPVRSLVDFRRVTLAPGESRTIRFTIRPDDLALYDLQMRRVVEPGTFTVWVGGSSVGGSEGHFTVTGDTLVLAPAVPRLE